MQKIELILETIRAVEGVQLLDVDSGAETNRTVVTFVGAPGPVADAAVAAVGRAAEVLDMRGHTGAHARHGATDVCPFVPVAGVSMDDCVAIAREVGERIGREHGIPVYLYDQAAMRPERRSLAKVRAGEYEALPDKLGNKEWEPDFGPAEYSEQVAKTGVVTVGAREFLIAYNVNLNSLSKAHADDIAFELREKGRALRRGQTTAFYSSGKLVKYSPASNEWPSAYDDFVAGSFAELEQHYRGIGRDLREELEFFGRDPEALEGVNVQRKGRFAECRGVGWVIPEYRRAQLSFNLTNYKVTSTQDVLEACRDLARERGLEVTGSEVVGMVPFQALRESGDWYLARQGSSRGLPVTDVIETAVQSMGLRDVAEFEPKASVLGLPSTDGELSGMKVCDLVDEVSRPSPAPGGGSIAALAGSLGASLGAMVANLTYAKKGLEDRREQMEGVAVRCQELKDSLLLAIDEDTAAFNDVLVAMRMPRATEAEQAARAQAIQVGYKRATTVPHRTAELCLESMRQCLIVAEKGLPASVTDAGVGALMGRAGVLGAVDNVRINLPSITDAGWVSEQRSRLDSLIEEANALEQRVRDIVDAALA
jgi:glutamate formiminotransferase/formiminotetrahydrofolate cyclodeaminase